MIARMISKLMYGLAAGGLVTFIVITILVAKDINPSSYTIWINMLYSFIIGIYFGLASFIFEYEKWSPLRKTMIHFSISIVVYYIVAISANWIPTTIPFIMLSFIYFVVIYSIFWFGFSLYYKHIAHSLNESLKK